MRVYISHIICQIVQMLFSIFGRVANRGNDIFKAACMGFEKHSNVFSNVLIREKYVNDSWTESLNMQSNNGELAIVLQGLIDTKDDFTLETVKIYQKLFPKSYIIISTWENTPQIVINNFIELGCEVILNKNFKEAGFCNINYQICTSLAGIKRAQELGCKYVLKNRSDMRIYKKNSFTFLKNLLTVFPVLGETVPLKARIVTLAGYYGQVFYPNWIQDFIYFGYTEDLLDLFDIPYDFRNSNVFQRNITNGRILCDNIPPEIYITVSFLSKYLVCENTVRFSWDMIRHYFVIIDFSDLNLMWHKYNYNYILRDSIQQNIQDTKYFTSWSFSLFLSLYCDSLQYLPDMELYRDRIKLK